jgi:hypothetical protein
MTDTRKIDAADYHIENLELAQTESQVLKVHRALLDQG